MFCGYFSGLGVDLGGLKIFVFQFHCENVAELVFPLQMGTVCTGNATRGFGFTPMETAAP